MRGRERMLNDLDDRDRRLLAIMGFAAMGLIAALVLSHGWFWKARGIPVPPKPENLITRVVQIDRVIASSARPVRRSSGRRAQDAGAPVTLLGVGDYPGVSFEIIGGVSLRRLDLPVVAELALEADPQPVARQAAENPYAVARVRVAGVRVQDETLVDPAGNYRRFRGEHREYALWGWGFLVGALLPLGVLGLAGRRLVRW